MTPGTSGLVHSVCGTRFREYELWNRDACIGTGDQIIKRRGEQRRREERGEEGRREKGRGEDGRGEEKRGTQGDFKFTATLLPHPHNCWEYGCVVSILLLQFLGEMIFLKNSENWAITG